MSNASKMTVSSISKKTKAKRQCGIEPSDLEGFINWYTNGDPDTIFVTVLSFLEWKGIHVKSDAHDNALPGRQWTVAFQQLAAKEHGDNKDMVVKRESNNYLLFDVKFMINNFDAAKTCIAKQIFGNW